jgi:S-(hydroxymethyl)glutathione dehydrogenase / alcohol dehydrogenase
MQAAVLREPGRPVRTEMVSLEPPRRGEVLVRVAAAGVCHSDLHLADGLMGTGRWPLVLGHEGAGVVVTVGDQDAELRPGDHVAFCLVPSCGRCRACRAGRRTLCEPAARSSLSGTMLDGSTRLRDVRGERLGHAFVVACFAEYAVVPLAGAVKLPPSIPLWQAALLGCGVVTGFGAVKTAGVSLGDSVCVIGCGGVGLQVVAAARSAGAGMIVAVDRDAESLERARRRGATHLVNATSGDPVATVVAATGAGAQYCFEVVGSAATLRQAFEALAPGGTAVVVGIAPRGVEASFPALDFVSEKTIKGCYYGSGETHAALGAYAQMAIDGRLELSDVISHVIALEEVEEALGRLRRGEGSRNVIVIDEQVAGRLS